MLKLNNQAVTDDQLKELFPDLPAGPLDVYRKKATFDWRRMKLVYDNLETLKLKNDIWNFMRENPLFRHREATPSLDEQRHITTKRMYAIYSQNFIPLTKIGVEPRLFQSEAEALFMFDSSLAVKISLTFRMFSNVIQGSGHSHHYSYIDQAQQGEIGGCFALTEVSHGSNAKGMRTTATYCPEKKQFIMHTPDFEAAKFWVGSLGKCATHAIVYAMLISKGKNHGLHSFVVPIRDPKTLKPYPGVTVGDIGEKIGLNGIDNGFMMFNNYHLPKEAILDKFGGVDDNGDYKTPFRDPNKRFGASLGILSGGSGQDSASLGIELHALSCAVKPVCAWAARDAIQACREATGGHGYLKERNFVPSGCPNTPLKFFILHSFVVPIRDPKTLKPYPGVTVGDIGEKIGLNGIDNGFMMFNNYHLPKEAILDKFGGVDDNGDYKTPFRDPNKRFGASLGILSGGRVHITSISANYMQKAIVIAIRYSAVRRQFGPDNSSEELPVLEYQQQSSGKCLITTSALGELRNDNDANCTYEGENSLLLQQTSNWLLAVWPRRHQLSPSDHPLTSLNFLENADHILTNTCPWTKVEDMMEPANIIEMYRWLTAYTLKTTYEKVESLKAAGRDNFQAKNESQPYNATTLSIVYGENFILNHFYKTAKDFHDLECRKVLLQLVSLYGVFLLEKHLATFYIVNIIEMYRWLTAYTLKTTYEKVESLKAAGRDNFQAKNESQPYNATTLSIVYGENFILNHFYKTAKDFHDLECRKVLLQLVSLYGVFLLEKHLATFYIGGYLSGRGRGGVLVREAVTQLSGVLAAAAPALADTLAPPDWCINSVLGHADGEVYKHLQNNVMTYPGALARPEWWRDVVHWQTYATSKL
ncbi:Peroxisomal acyl-coenzyme A oxidase 3 [Papilio machaon]|uniref:Peroxisomal acyl-coenzyme A oxidase 3 n=1 Tax=Papilio machaon TaxID=76193 RepID=A0A194RNN2_PAPMA|nr:Peroxisomal acyl-coenzyme A oxidase 3 [Papilio machaon]